MLSFCFKALKNRPCYEALERISDALEQTSSNSEVTAKVLDNLIDTTAELASKIKTISAEEVEEVLNDIENQLREVTGVVGKSQKTTVEVGFETAIRIYENQIDFNTAKVYLSGVNDVVYVCSNDAYFRLKVIETDGAVSFQFVPAEEDVSRLKLKELELDTSLDNANGIRKAIIAEYFPEFENEEQYSEDIRAKISELKKQKAEKEEQLENINKLFSVQKDGEISGVLREDGTYCVIHEAKHAMAEFSVKNGKMVAKLYMDYDNSDSKNPKAIGNGKQVGEWKNGVNDKVHSKVGFDREYIFRDIIKSSVTNSFLTACGLSNNDVKTMLKEQGTKGFKKTADDNIPTIMQIKDAMDKDLPQNWSVRLINDTSTFLCITSDNGNKTYINFDEKGDVSQYAYKYTDEKDVKLVAERGKVVMREERASQEDYKRSILLYEKAEAEVKDSGITKIVKNKSSEPKKTEPKGKDGEYGRN